MRVCIKMYTLVLVGGAVYHSLGSQVRKWGWWVPDVVEIHL